MIAFRDQVRTYARGEYERGATPEEVYERVALNGKLWALKSSVEAEYLDYLGVPRRKARMVSIVAAMACYFFLAGFTPQNNLVLRYGIEVVVAMLLARTVETYLTRLLRTRWENEKARNR